MTPLSPAICALLGFTALTVVLALGYVGYRVALVLSFKAAANSWTRGAASHVDPAIVTRVQHAHMNCIENLPVFATVVFIAYAMGQLALIDATMVFIRGNLWLAQMSIIVFWLWQLYAAH